jgi:hypothetical protein
VEVANKLQEIIANKMVKTMKLASVTLEYIKDILQTEQDFSDLVSWKFDHINVGEMKHKYKISKSHEVYFVKEVKLHEAQVINFLVHLDLSRLPSTPFPKLIKHKILVQKYIPDKPLKNKKLDIELIRQFAIFQNRMNDKSFFDRYNILDLENYGQEDNGFFKGYTGSKNFTYAENSLNQLSGMSTLKIIPRFWEILEHLKKDKQSITNDFSSMPFARQHHDFKENNLIGKQQKLIDWGSSYGYGPFMYDLAPFLINDHQALETYIKTSDICRNSSIIQVKRWLYVALAARFLSLLRWDLHPNEPRALIHTEKKCKDFMEYEYKTYKRLLV